MVRLNGWAVVRSRWAAPEQAVYLTGNVEGHAKFVDGDHVTTSAVSRFEGRIITTESGTQYLLGDPSPEYREWLQEYRPNWDPEQPFTSLQDPLKDTAS
jgi:hypothetical protein